MKFKTLSLAFICFIISCPLHGQDTTRVLFIGNSYTYFWNLPQVVQALAVTQNVPLVTAQSTIGGADLGQHWRSARNLKSHEKLEKGNWDYVVLQDHSMRSIQKKDSLDYYMNLWIQKIKKHGAEPLLYMTWARAFNPLMQDQISEGYESIGVAHNVAVAPVGKVWEVARHNRQDFDIYDPDGSHPAPLGTYLSALTFYKTITGHSVKGLPTRLISKDGDEEKLYLMIVSRQDAAFAQDAVEQVLSNYQLAKIKTR